MQKIFIFCVKASLLYTLYRVLSDIMDLPILEFFLCFIFTCIIMMNLVHVNFHNHTHNIIPEGDMVSGERQVLSLAPWNKHDLSMRSFADRYE